MGQHSRELIFKAIDSYDLYTNSMKLVLKALIELSINDVTIISVLKLSALSKVSRPVAYQALEVFEENRVVTREKRPKSKVSVFHIDPNKLNEMVERYKLQENMLNK